MPPVVILPKVGFGCKSRYTVEALSKAGFNVAHARDIIGGAREISSDERLVVTMDGAELSRGGGGCRCMTMPASRQDI